ncbi:MAG TPA: serine/threonine-protein kinase [Nannocystaceae bacterium]|nr:serine/threonine-protein kinase [Nannocystaceae bacterium]
MVGEDDDAIAIATLVRAARDDGRDPVAELLRSGVRAKLLGIAAAPPRIGRFVVLEIAGRGATGTVFAAYDPRLDRKVALKLLHACDDERVLDEARALARLAHPHVVAVYEADRAEQGTFVVMQFVAGGDLRTWLKDRPDDWRAIVSAFVGLAEGIAAAHAAGIVHGDVKPENILVAAHGPCIADFGVGNGTLGYLAPERRDGGPASAAADQYAFASTLREALAGTTAPQRVRAILARAEQADPGLRFGSMAELADELRATLRPRRWPIAIAAVASLAVALVITRRDVRCAGGDARIAAVWSSARAQQLRTTFVAAAPLGDALARPVIDAIDRDAVAWAHAHREVCEATWVRAEQSDALHDARMRCLARRLDELDAAITTLAGVDDAEEAAGAMAVVDALPELERCSADRVRTDDEPHDERIAATRRELDHAWAAFNLARYAAARAEAERIATQAEAIGWAPLQLEADILLGATQARIDAPAVADATLHRAYLSAMALGDDAAAADIALRILRSAMFAGRLDRVQTLADFARGAALRAGLDDTEVDGIVGEALLGAGDAVAATSALERALAGERRAPRRAILYTLLGSAALARQRPDAALAHYSTALGSAEAHYGAGHPEIGFFLQRLGRGQHAVGDDAAALATLQRALALREQALGGEDRAVASALADLADVELAIGRRTDAQVHLERALAIRTKHDAEHPRLAELHRRLAAIARQDGDVARARSHLERAIELRRASTPDHPELLELERERAELAADQR